MTIEYTNKNGRAVTYTPDFLVQFEEPNEMVCINKISRKPWLIEVKPREILKKEWDKLKPKFKIAIKYARENNLIFKIFDETKIRTSYLV